MRIYGLDFTSAPSREKPITVAICQVADDALSVLELSLLTAFDQFEALLATQGPWIAGIDFPFGQSRQLIDGIGWPDSWYGYVDRVSRLSPSGFEDVLTDYRNAQPAGQKQPKRETDELADSCSPMMLYGVPVGKMFFQGARGSCAPTRASCPATLAPPTASCSKPTPS